MRKGRTVLIACVVVAFLAIAIGVHSAVARKTIESRFLELKSAINAKDYTKAYAMTTPAYRASHSLENFTSYESWRGDVRDSNLRFSAFLRHGSVKADTSDSVGWWNLSFEYSAGAWNYTGNRTAFVDFL